MAYAGYVNAEVAKMYGIPYNKLTAKQKKILHADSLRRAKLIQDIQNDTMKNGAKAFTDEAKLERVLGNLYRDCQKQILADVTETLAKVKKDGGTWSYANKSALTRSRGLFEQITKELTKLGQKENSAFYSGLSNIYTDQYLREMFTLGQFTEVKASLNRLNADLVRKTLDYPWSGAMFSDRLWDDKEKLGKNLRAGLTQSMILGEGIPKMTERINKNIETAKYNAERVARTETKRVTYCAHDDVYNDCGVEELKYRCANGGDNRVCALCMGDNEKIFKRGEEPTLPRHPNCRCIYIPVVPDTFEMNELNELTNSVRGAENYEKWVNDNLDKLNPDGTLKDGWERDWRDGGKLVYTGDPANLAPTPKTAQELVQESVNKILADNDILRKDIQSQISAKNTEYSNLPSKYKAQEDSLRQQIADTDTKVKAKMAEVDKLNVELDEVVKKRNAITHEFDARKISNEEYQKRKENLQEQWRELKRKRDAAENEYYNLQLKIQSLNNDINNLSKQLANDRSRILKEISDLDDKVKLLYNLDKDLQLDIDFVGDSMEHFDRLEDFREIRKALRETPTFDFDTYSAELVQMARRMDDDAIKIQTAMTEFVKKNNYSATTGDAYYYPFSKSITMDMSSNTHERALKNGLKGAWQTKYHEEGHQLDHLLCNVEEITETKGIVSRAFTSNATNAGQKISAALEADLLDFVNKSIAYYNNKNSSVTGFNPVKPLKSLSRISRETIFAFDEYYGSLTAMGTDSAESCRLGILMDALGLFTQDRLSVNRSRYGGWGHKPVYNKSKDGDGANSETWATFCALRTAGDGAEIKTAKSVLPKTWAVMDDIFHRIAEYVKTNKLKY